jgi:hypothetical protein
MSHWKNPTVNLGVIKAGFPKKVIFQALDTIPVISIVSPYCGCTTTDFDKVKKELVVTYNNSSIPNQVQGAQSIKKRISIIYEDDSTETLIITATRIR